MSLKTLVDWQPLGLALGLLYHTLKKIENDHRDKTDKCKMEMLAAWLQQLDHVPQKGVPSWSVLQAALRRMGEEELASRIMVSHEYITVMVCAVNKLSLIQEEEEPPSKQL